MRERKRLIELLKQTCHCKDEDCSNCSSNGICFAHREADYLLDNGVIVPPVKVGDDVYTVNKRNGVETKRVVEISWKRDWAGTDLGWGLILSGKRSNNRYNISNIGKTVFLTKEEAEKALKGGATNEL